MTENEFNEFVDIVLVGCKELLKSKGADYSDQGDRLSNFKEIAAKLKLTPMQIWSVYFNKHVEAINKYCANGAVQSEPIGGRFADTINYLFLGCALVNEENKRNQIVMPGIPDEMQKEMAKMGIFKKG